MIQVEAPPCAVWPTRATDPMLPSDMLDQLGVQRDVRFEYEMADGTRRMFDVGGGRVEIEGVQVYANVIFGPTGCEPILGATPLESAGFRVDPQNRRLRKQRRRI